MPVDVSVVGSINVDFTAYVDTCPMPGQTVTGNKFAWELGGKGANQAVAVARMGKKAGLVGCVGNDYFGNDAYHSLSAEGIHMQYVRKIPGVSTGCAFVTIDGRGENTMAVIPGANGNVSSELVNFAESEIRNAQVLLVQLEVPAEAILHAMRIARKNGKLVILDPGPADRVQDDFLSLADICIPNQQEAEKITQIRVTDEVSATKAAEKLFLEFSISRSVIKLGEGGLVAWEKGRATFVPAMPVNAVSTVGAGDCFAGAFASGLVGGLNIVKAAQLGTVAAGLKVTRHGAQSGIPLFDEVQQCALENGIFI